MSRRRRAPLRLRDLAVAMAVVVAGRALQALSTRIAPAVSLPLSVAVTPTWKVARLALGPSDSLTVGLLGTPISRSLNSAVLVVPSVMAWTPITLVCTSVLHWGLIIVPEKYRMHPGPPMFPT